MYISYVLSKWLPFFCLLRWHDCIEIICFATVIYYFSQWLSCDKQKNLVLPFYGFCLALCASHLLGLFSIHFLLMYSAPFIFMLFILFHQQILQKNFINSRKAKIKIEEIKNDWIEILIRGCLHAINTEKPLFLVIEQQDVIGSYFDMPFLINADLELVLLEVLIESSRFNSGKMIIIESSGYLKGINASWHDELTDTLVGDELLESWQECALALTHKTDAIVLKICPEERLFTVIMQGKMIQHLAAATVVTLLKNSTQFTTENKKNSSSPIKGVFNESFAQKSSFEQTQP